MSRFICSSTTAHGFLEVSAPNWTNVGQPQHPYHIRSNAVYCPMQEWKRCVCRVRRFGGWHV